MVDACQVLKARQGKCGQRASGVPFHSAGIGIIAYYLVWTAKRKYSGGREKEELIISVSKRGVTGEDEKERRVHGVLLRGRKSVKSFTGMKNLGIEKSSPNIANRLLCTYNCASVSIQEVR